MSVFQDLYDSEINFQVSTQWDIGFNVKLGDEQNGFVAEARFDRFGEIAPWLTRQAIEHFPESMFARIYQQQAHAYSVIAETFGDERDAEPRLADDVGVYDAGGEDGPSSNPARH